MYRQPASSRLRSPARPICVTALAVVERECHLAMARPAVSAFNIREHRVDDGAFSGSWEYLGMTEFAAVPGGMFLVRKSNRMNPRVACLNRKVFPVLHGRLSYRETFHKIDRGYDSRSLRLLPIHAVNPFGESRSEPLVF